MNRKVLLHLCLMILTAHMYADGVTQRIDRVCQFTFPAAPQVSEAPGIINYMLLTDSCSFLVQVVRHQKVEIHDTAMLSNLYTGTVTGLMRGYHGSLISGKRFNIQGLDGLEIEYVKPDKDHQPEYIFSRILLLYDKLVVYSFSAPYSRYKEMKEERQRFFSSFALAKYNPSPSGDDTVSPPMPKYDSAIAHLQKSPPRELVKPNTLHFIISFAISILLLAGILYMLVRWKKKRADS